MTAYFVDTWFFIAYLRESDPHHQTVIRLAGILSDASFVTHDGVLSELPATSGESTSPRSPETFCEAGSFGSRRWIGTHSSML